MFRNAGKILSAVYFILLNTAAVYSETIDTLLWSENSTWGGIKPQTAAEVIVPAGTIILLDENSPDLGGLIINGTLVFDRKNLTLSAKWIMIHGKMEIGNESNPFTHKAVVTLTGNQPDENVMGMGTRGIMVMGGILELIGNPPLIPWTKLNENAPAGSTSLTLQEAVNWNPADEVVIGPTDYFLAGNGSSVTHKSALTSVTDNQVQISDPLNAHRWGQLQYATATGMSLTQENRVSPPLPNTDSTFTPTILDERAPVGNLTRNIVIQSLNDDLWQNQGLGVHVMIMGTGSVAKINGVEIKRGGQSGKIARYPFHWHMLSYNGTQTLADISGHYFKNSTVNESATRGLVIHGTNGAVVQNNIIYSTKGHGIFLEDAVERRNTIEGNLVLKVRNPSETKALKNHEISETGSSGYWLSNPDNTIKNNTAADCQGHGFWIALPSKPFGAGNQVLHTDGLLLRPNRLRFGLFEGNTAHSNRKDGIHFDDPEIDEEGNTYPLQYESTTTGRATEWPFTTLRRFTLSKFSVWKNGHSGIWDRSVWVNNLESVSADNCGRFFAGSGSNGLIERCLVVGTSLNYLMNGTDRPQFEDRAGGNQTPAAFATYHSTFDIRNNILINFPMVENTRSGAFATEDYYTRPVDKGHFRNTDNLLIQTDYGIKLPSVFSYYKLAGALWDPYNSWGGTGSNSYFVYDFPFFTYGQTSVPVSLGSSAGGVLVNGPFYGINDFVVNKANESYEDLMAVRVKRLNAGFSVVGEWEIAEAGNTNWFLGHMRHAALQNQGIFELDFPTIGSVSDVALTIENMLTTNDSLIMAVEYDGSYSVQQVYTSSWPDFMAKGHEEWPTSYDYKHVFKPLNSKEQVMASSEEAFWHDKANHRVWMKIRGGIKQIWKDSDYPVTDDRRLYRLFALRIYGSMTSTNIINRDNRLLPEANRLHPNTPNPFNPSTVIQFDVKDLSHVTIEIFSLTGQLIGRLVDQSMSPGAYQVNWNAQSHSSGIYLVRFQSGQFNAVRKISLLK